MPGPSQTIADFFVAGQKLGAPPLDPGLYVVATPIGNLGDISLRALMVLAAADTILCEDTRHSARLLDHYGISARRMALHEHNEQARIETVLARLADGAALALISDAGTPLISDPGFPLVRAVRAAGYPVVPIPGASALLAALQSAGLPTDRFSFFGFLPPRASARDKALAALATRSETLVFYESPRRLGACLAALAAAFGAERQALVALELTKRFERLTDGTLGELAAHFTAGPQKGEAVILVSGATEQAADPEAWRAALDEALSRQSLRDAVDEISGTFGVKRKRVYDQALARRK